MTGSHWLIDGPCSQSGSTITHRNRTEQWGRMQIGEARRFTVQVEEREITRETEKEPIPSDACMVWQMKFCGA